MARPVPVYMEVTPPGVGRLLVRLINCQFDIDVRLTVVFWQFNKSIPKGNRLGSIPNENHHSTSGSNTEKETAVAWIRA